MPGRMLAVLLVASLLIGQSCCLEIFDILGPIVKISPARQDQITEDRFGFSATAHRFEDVLPTDTLEEALAKTTILVGAPKGKFPGGISGLEYGYLACAEAMDTTDMTILMATTQEERAECLANFTFGLVYRCELNSSDCGALIGNGDPISPDGYLFERSGNNEDKVESALSSQRGPELKEDQQMGFNVYSNNGFFVACAPFWKISPTESDQGPQPRGRCVYSGQGLSDFVPLIPCQSGNGLNQNIGGYCTTGLGQGVSTKEGTSTIEILLGTPGRSFSRGGVAYYENATDTMLAPFNGGEFKAATAYPSIGGSDPVDRQNYENTPIPRDQVAYYGFAIDSGNIFSLTTTDSLVGAPRYNSMDFVGYVYSVPSSPGNINNDYQNVIPSYSIKGQQYGEMFGYAVALADLNNDGYDDAIIGAPLYYERSLPELGRIFIYENDKGNGFLETPVIIAGYASGSRFGSKVVALGDLNNDGFEDFAVSAPYEGSGVVYVYHGQERDSDGSIVDTQFAQRIDGGSFADRVSNISDVSMFGFSLAGNVDVDNNQYRDLVVGAFSTQTVFVLRSRPFATMVTNLTSVDEEVQLTSFGCELSGKRYACVKMEFCASYTGKSIASQFSTTVRVQETSRPRRIQFGADFNTATITLPITFYGENNASCVAVTGYIRNDTTSLEPFLLSAELMGIDRPEVVVDTTTPPSDLSSVPVIQADAAPLQVGVFAECGPDDICMSDLEISIANVTYRSRGGALSEDQNNLVIDDVQFVEIASVFRNSDEDAFNAFVTITIPRKFFTYDLVFVEGTRVTCSETTPDSKDYDVRVCGVRTPLSSSAGDIPFVLRLLVNPLLGNEGSTMVTMEISVGNSTRNTEPSDRLGNNIATAEMSLLARSVFSVFGSFESDTITYQGNHTPSIDNDVRNLGRNVLITSTFRNGGPTTIRNATLTLYLPTNSSETGEFFYFYPASVSTSADNVQCSMDGINPSGFRVGGARKKRMIRSRRGLTRVARQEIEMERPNLDCEETPESCLKVTCDIVNLGRSTVDVIFSGYLDERFFDDKDTSFLLQTFVTGEVAQSFYNTEGSVNNATFSVSLIFLSTFSPNTGIPWYVIAAPIAGAIIFLILLTVPLYFFGFFKRKGAGKEVAEDDEFDQFDSNPFGRGAAPTAPPPDAELTKYEKKGRDE